MEGQVSTKHSYHRMICRGCGSDNLRREGPHDVRVCQNCRRYVEVDEPLWAYDRRAMRSDIRKLLGYLGLSAGRRKSAMRAISTLLAVQRKDDRHAKKVRGLDERAGH